MDFVDYSLAVISFCGVLYQHPYMLIPSFIVYITFFSSSPPQKKSLERQLYSSIISRVDAVENFGKAFSKFWCFQSKDIKFHNDRPLSTMFYQLYKNNTTAWFRSCFKGSGGFRCRQPYPFPPTSRDTVSKWSTKFFDLKEYKCLELFSRMQSVAWKAKA